MEVGADDRVGTNLRIDPGSAVEDIGHLFEVAEMAAFAFELFRPTEERLAFALGDPVFLAARASAVTKRLQRGDEDVAAVGFQGDRKARLISDVDRRFSACGRGAEEGRDQSR